MQKRQLGNTDLQLSVIGLGAWAIGGDWVWGWGHQDDADSIATIQRALDLGINWIDTAAVYGLGRSEEVVGRAIKGRRDQVIIATKCGLVWDDPAGGTPYNSLRPESIRKEVEDSLRRLDTDVIDLYQIHWPSPDATVEEAWPVMAELVQAGKVRHIGVSNFDVAQMKAAQAIHPVASSQPPYSMLRRDIEDDILPFCRENNIGVIPYSPMRSGLLTDSFNPDRLAASDWRRKNIKQAEFDRAAALVEKLRPIAQAAGRTVANLAVAWVNAQPGITSAIVGARRVDQVEQNVKAGEWDLSADELAAVEAVLNTTA